jgi:hypothetical protein
VKINQTLPNYLFHTSQEYGHSLLHFGHSWWSTVLKKM